MKPRFVLLLVALLAWCAAVEGRPMPGTSGKHNEDLDGIGGDLEEFLNHRDQTAKQKERENVYSGTNRNQYNPGSIVDSILGRPSSSGSSSVMRPSAQPARPAYPSAPSAPPARPAYPSAPSAPPAQRPYYPSAPSAPLYPSLPASDSSRPGGSWMNPSYPSYPTNAAPARNQPYPNYPTNAVPARNPLPYPSNTNYFPSYPSYPSYSNQQSQPSYPSGGSRQSAYPSYNAYPQYQSNRPYPTQQGVQRYDTSSARRPPPPPGPASSQKPSKSISSRISNFFKKIVS